MTVRTVKRRGKRRLIIDIVYKNRDGTEGRFRRDAEVQTLAAARSEERRRLALLVETGTPDGTSASPGQSQSDEAPMAEAGRIDPSAPLFSDVADDYLRDFAESHLKPSTRRGYGVVLRTFLVPRIGHRRIDNIDAKIVRELDAEMARRKTKLSTRRNIQVVLRSVLCRYAVEAGLLTEPPRLPRMPRVGVTIVSVLSSEDVTRLIDATTEPYRLPLMLAAYAGLRAGEIRGLRWRDVELAAGRLIVRQNLCRGEVSTPKSGSERIVPLVPELKSMLDAITSKPRDGYVATAGEGKPWSEFAVMKAFKRACAKAGLTGWRFHDLRHAFVTALFRAGVGAPTVQALAGHSDLKTTQRYAHAAEVDLEDAIRRLRGNRVVTGVPGP